MSFLKNHWSRWPPRTCTKDLVGMRVPDVTPLTLKSVFDFFLGDRKVFFGLGERTPSGAANRGFYTHREEGCPYARSTFIVTLGVAELYSESVGVEVWGEGMTRHVALMACAAVVGLAHHPDASTSVADVAADLATELARTCRAYVALPLRHRSKVLDAVRVFPRRIVIGWSVVRMSQQRVAVVRTATTDGRRQWPWPARDAAAATVFWRRKRVQRSRRRLRQQRREDRNRGGRRRKRRTRKRAATTCGCCGRKGGKEDYGSGSSGWKSRRKQRRLEERATAVAGSWQRRQRRRWAREEEDSSRRLRMAGAGGCCDRGDCGRGKKRRQRGPARKQAAGASAMGSVDVASGGDSGRGWAATGRGGRKRAAAVRRGLRQREREQAVASA
ncbi:hypothetical protein BHE74_00041050 [Ensete ventricosum]|nr:hypothetical protein BHE74_00041050 [Ensete ventricosum]